MARNGEAELPGRGAPSIVRALPQPFTRTPQEMTGPTTIRVGSSNPAKLQPVHDVALTLFDAVEVEGVEIPSGVFDQPKSDEETLRGALTRAQGALLSGPADYGVGIEGGIANLGGMWFGFTWVVVVDRRGRAGIASSARFALPRAVADGIHAGGEMSKVVDRLVGTECIGRKEGLMGLLTDGRVTRSDGIVQALHFAFGRFLAAAALRDD
jgi:inosine/xanthosine triphosphatase